MLRPFPRSFRYSFLFLLCLKSVCNTDLQSTFHAIWMCMWFSCLPDWYYHAPIKRTTKSPKAAPPASQIPGIGGLKDEFANPESDERHFRRKWIRDTDSKYIKMAKQGGRKNLLAYHSPPVKPDEPVPYPRVEWFDHDHPEEDDEAGQPAQLQEHDKEPAKEGYVFHKLQEFYSYGQCVSCKIWLIKRHHLNKHLSQIYFNKCCSRISAVVLIWVFTNLHPIFVTVLDIKRCQNHIAWEIGPRSTYKY